MSEGAAASDGAERAERRTPRPEERLPARGQGGVMPPRRALAPMPTRPGRHFAARSFGVIGVSLGAHMALMGVLGFIPSPLIAMRKEVEMEIIQPEPPPPPPPPAAEEPKPPEPVAARPKLVPKVSAPKPETKPEPPKNEPPPANEAPVDLTGVTLTGDNGSWSSVVGNGSAMQGPAARIGKVTGRDRAGSNSGAIDGRGTTLVGEASLSRKPVPPDGMNELLEQNFPARARAQGVAGSARLRVRILADGRVGDMKVLRESGDYGFG
ncbi:MAG TPA: TonB family protein, partial [Polyangiales bacterium]